MLKQWIQTIREKIKKRSNLEGESGEDLIDELAADMAEPTTEQISSSASNKIDWREKINQFKQNLMQRFKKTSAQSDSEHESTEIASQDIKSESDLDAQEITAVDDDQSSSDGSDDESGVELEMGSNELEQNDLEVLGFDDSLVDNQDDVDESLNDSLDSEVSNEEIISSDNEDELMSGDSDRELATVFGEATTMESDSLSETDAMDEKEGSSESTTVDPSDDIFGTIESDLLRPQLMMVHFQQTLQHYHRLSKESHVIVPDDEDHLNTTF